MNKQQILPIWQPLGFSTHIIAKKVSEKFGVKTSHTGTLDPMAEGVIIVLLGEERLKKYEYACWAKGYRFNLVTGISTDTYDAMGKITEISIENDLNEDEIRKVSNSFLGDYEQIVPFYSTKKIKGKHLHEYAREGEKIELPKKKGKIFKLNPISVSKKSIKELALENIENIKKVEGDFRQDEIIKEWEKLSSEDVTLWVVTFYAETSKGIYVRSLSQDICRKLNVIGHADSIVREKNGDYNRNNSLELKSLLD